MAAAEKTGVIPFGDPRQEPEGLAKLREPFPPHQVSKLPKGTKAQNDCPASEKRNCDVCGGWHHPKVVHLDYVGHAALTDRLLDVDPHWSWAPMALDDNGLPRFDASGGLWIKLTVCGVTRLGYGHAQAKGHMDIGAREKEVIGDALRNAAMRFGAALDLWHKGELHVEPDDESEPAPAARTERRSDPPPAGNLSPTEQLAAEYLAKFGECQTTEDVERHSKFIRENWGKVKGARGFSEQVVKARNKAFERCKAPARDPGQEG